MSVYWLRVENGERRGVKKKEDAMQRNFCLVYIVEDRDRLLSIEPQRSCHRLSIGQPQWPWLQFSNDWLVRALRGRLRRERARERGEKRELLISLNEYNNNIRWPSSVHSAVDRRSSVRLEWSPPRSHAHQLNFFYAAVEYKWTGRMSMCYFYFSWSSWLCIRLITVWHPDTQWD